MGSREIYEGTAVMTDKLRARARELAERVDRDLNSAKSINVDPVAHIESALLQYAREALREGPDVYMSEIARIVWRDEAEARARGLE